MQRNIKQNQKIAHYNIILLYYNWHRPSYITNIHKMLVLYIQPLIMGYQIMHLIICYNKIFLFLLNNCESYDLVHGYLGFDEANDSTDH